jgi:hypothetical protein
MRRTLDSQQVQLSGSVSRFRRRWLTPEESFVLRERIRNAEARF